MKTRDKYGFKVLNENGLGFYRWFNGNTVKITDNKEGKLPANLNYICTVQYCVGFYIAYGVCKKLAEKNDLQFIQLTEQDWKNRKNLIKDFFKRLFSSGIK